MNYASIPGEMKALPNWILYRLEDRGGEKPTKVPYTVGGSCAKTNDPSTWATFDAALAAFQRGGYAGLGFVFTGTPYVGIDIDGCVDPAIGKASPEAQDAVRILSSYAELSQSRKGLHIIIKGTLPAGRRRNGAFEMYGEGSPRYFAMTGELWDGLSVILENQAAIDEVHRKYIQPEEKDRTATKAAATPTRAPQMQPAGDGDEQLLNKARRTDPVLDALYRGDWKGRYPSQSEADLALCSKLAFWFQKDAVRIDRIFRQSSLFRAKWDEKHFGDGSTYGQKTVEMAISGCRDVYVPKAGSHQESRSVPSVSDAMVQALMSLHPEKNDRYAWNDIGNGNLFADLYKLRARYVPERSKWAVFDGRIWQFDLGGLAVMHLCKELSDSLMTYALTITDEKARQEYIRFLSRWQRRAMRETILKDAASVYPLPFVSFDRDPMLINCQNGTLNLDNGRFTPHRPEDYLSKMSGVVYDPDAKCERWEQFIAEVMQGDAGKARFLQKALGYALTGDARHECFFILYGPSSRNGKGTTMETFARLMGDYGKSAKPDTIAQRQTANGSGPSEDIARLIGARFVNVSEPDKKMVLSAALVKTLTGRDTVTARFLHENSIEFRPEFKLFINTNYLPQVTDVTLFSSGRVMVIPFERHFREHEQDRDLKDILAQPESLSGILNWALAGLRGVIDEGLNPPASIKIATDEYRERSDKIGRFVAEVLEENPLAEEQTTKVFARYQAWCIANGIHSESLPNFNAQLRNYGRIEKRRPAGSARTASPVSTLLGFRLPQQPQKGFSNTEEARYGH